MLAIGRDDAFEGEVADDRLIQDRQRRGVRGNGEPLGAAGIREAHAELRAERDAGQIHVEIAGQRTRDAGRGQFKNARRVSDAGDIRCTTEQEIHIRRRDADQRRRCGDLFKAEVAAQALTADHELNSRAAETRHVRREVQSTRLAADGEHAIHRRARGVLLRAETPAERQARRADAVELDRSARVERIDIRRVRSVAADEQEQVAVRDANSRRAANRDTDRRRADEHFREVVRRNARGVVVVGRGLEGEVAAKVAHRRCEHHVISTEAGDAGLNLERRDHLPCTAADSDAAAHVRARRVHFRREGSGEGQVRHVHQGRRTRGAEGVGVRGQQ